MDGSDPNPNELWESPSAAAVQDLYGPPGAELVIPDPQILTAVSDPEEVAGRLFACESLKTAPAKHGPANDGEPYTLQWFLNIENHRHGRHARWLPRLLEFAKHRGESLLGLGHGLGTDWLQYARNGAAVTVCSSCHSQIELIRRNFQLRGLQGRFLHSAPSALPLASSSIDVACISGLLQDVAEPQAVVEEVFRVLKPGGKVIAVTPAKYDVDYWRNTVFFWQRWLGSRTHANRRSERKFTSRRLRRLFQRFEIHRITKRQLRRSELPHLWRLWPVPVLERVMGRVLVLKAFKPISIALQALAAA
jgi:ubiquinone/menaquinone biosynthesis C-methylase UbiE